MVEQDRRSEGSPLPKTDTPANVNTEPRKPPLSKSDSDVLVSSQDPQHGKDVDRSTGSTVPTPGRAQPSASISRQSSASTLEYSERSPIIDDCAYQDTIQGYEVVSKEEPKADQFMMAENHQIMKVFTQQAQDHSFVDVDTGLSKTSSSEHEGSRSPHKRRISETEETMVDNLPDNPNWLTENMKQSLHYAIQHMFKLVRIVIISAVLLAPAALIVLFTHHRPVLLGIPLLAWCITASGGYLSYHFIGFLVNHVMFPIIDHFTMRHEYAFYYIKPLQRKCHLFLWVTTLTVWWHLLPTLWDLGGNVSIYHLMFSAFISILLLLAAFSVKTILIKHFALNFHMSTHLQTIHDALFAEYVLRVLSMARKSHGDKEEKLRGHKRRQSEPMHCRRPSGNSSDGEDSGIGEQSRRPTVVSSLLRASLARASQTMTSPSSTISSCTSSLLRQTSTASTGTYKSKEADGTSVKPDPTGNTSATPPFTSSRAPSTRSYLDGMKGCPVIGEAELDPDTMPISPIVPNMSDNSTENTKEQEEVIDEATLKDVLQQPTDEYSPQTMHYVMDLVRKPLTMVMSDAEIKQMTQDTHKLTISARILTSKIFHNLTLRGKRQITEPMLRRYFSAADARRAFMLLNSGPSGKNNTTITFHKVYNVIQTTLRERYWLAQTLSDADKAMGKLDKVVSSFLSFLLFFVVLLIFGIDFETLVLGASTLLLAISFSFGVAIKELLDDVIFVFVVHPYDCGDRCLIDDQLLQVYEIHLKVTTFHLANMEKIYYPNTKLMRKRITNFNRSPDMWDVLEFCVAHTTTAEQIKALENEVYKFMAQNNADFHADGLMFVCDGLGFDNRILIKCWFQHTANWQNLSLKAERHSKMLMFMMKALKRHSIGYDFYPQRMEFTSPLHSHVHHRRSPEDGPRSDYGRFRQETVPDPVVPMSPPAGASGADTGSAKGMAGMGRTGLQAFQRRSGR
eukprot:Clim_evm58s251 gene=Clim_evmTU58s251